MDEPDSLSLSLSLSLSSYLDSKCWGGGWRERDTVRMVLLDRNYIATH